MRTWYTRNHDAICGLCVLIVLVLLPVSFIMQSFYATSVVDRVLLLFVGIGSLIPLTIVVGGVGK